MSQSCCVVILTKNEEQELPGLLENLDGLGIPVVVIDSGSEDRTVQIAKEHGATVFFCPTTDFASLRNYALDSVSAEWVLFVDADERLSEKLKETIRNLLASDALTEGDAYSFKRISTAFGKHLRHTWQDWVTRLVNVSRCRFRADKLVHEEVVCKGTIKKIKQGYIEHKPYRDFFEYLDKMYRYVHLEAESLIKRYENRQLSIPRIILSATMVFFDRLLRKGWILDGFAGVHASLTAFVVRFLTLTLCRSELYRGNLYGGKRREA